MKDSINVLGQEYKLILDTPETNPKLADVNGYMEPYSKKIVIDRTILDSHDVKTAENFEARIRQTYRHEIVHAFFEESSLTYKFNNFEDEEFLVHWIAAQFPKMRKIFDELEVSD